MTTGSRSNRRFNFVGPLLAETRRSEHENPIGHPAVLELGRDQPRLDRLPEADFVGDQHPARKPAHDRQGRLELVRQQIDPRAFRRLQAVRRAVRRNQLPAAAPPAACARPGEPPSACRRLDIVERRDDVCRSSRIRSGCAGQRHDLTGRVRTDGDDAPALAPCEDDIAGPKGLLVHHRRRSSRVQKLLRGIGNARQTRTRRRARR